jgi:predicted TIM-barrel fold metal-dependent hydrolase
VKPIPEARPLIDVHCHFLPTAYRQELEKAGRAGMDAFPLPQWSAEKHLEDMEQMGVDIAILNLSSPDINWGDDQIARRLARDANEVAAETVRTYPARFGFFATLPLPDIDASLAELEYAFDVLHADGVRFYSNSRGVYLGDPRLEPVFAELSRRKAVVTMHPVKPLAGPEGLFPSYKGHPWLDFMFESTRALANLIANDVFVRNPGIKFICPHLGTLFPLLAGRMQNTAKLLIHYGVADQGFEVPDVRGVLGDLYYDIAGGFALPVQVPALLSIGRVDHMVFGSDYPFAPAAVGAQVLDEFRHLDLLTPEEREGVLSVNALRLFPRLGD